MIGQRNHLTDNEELTTLDKLNMRDALNQYMKNKRMIDQLSKQATLTPRQTEILELEKWSIENIDMAFQMIEDEEVKRIIEHRYIKLGRHKDAVMYYRSIMSERTIDRRINAGIESMARTLKLWGVL
ncbi:hypothetical protein J2Z69_003660 [Paenibacillus shirakamiensis]|uniref:Uncharacterized protein n=1 Tax=Paenibacillus shirakamiensis TaxID=1265935 RepID=A0ABS4JPM1_9BACL|nr:hypothetical protein [Paenibacillus shirakamiensis]MBP2002574.1 hypothetical protein [Paenibacillus shirakamiensis]